MKYDRKAEGMGYIKKLGVFAKIPEKGKVKTRLVPPLSEEEVVELSRSFVMDTLERLAKLKKISGTLFLAGKGDHSLGEYLPRRYEIIEQKGGSLGSRLLNAFRHLLKEEGSSAVVIGTDSPDIPIKYIKRAFHKLKHKDVVIGPSADGGYYLIGLKKPREELFTSVNWGESTVFRETIDIIDAKGLSLSLLPLWYDVDDTSSLELLKAMIKAKRIERSGRLPATEKFLEELFR